MHPNLTIAQRAALAAGEIIRNAYPRVTSIANKEKSKNNFVTEIDLFAEQEIIKVISKSYPEHGILGEETGQINQDSEYQWVIDPIDGTTNFMKGFPHFAVSIALFKDNKPEVAVVYQPITDELFTAVRGEGATLDNKKLRVSNSLPENAIIATGIPFKTEGLVAKQLGYMDKVLNTFPDIRRTGSAALDLCYVASGRVDGFFELDLKKWDIAAGVLIAQESGAIVSDINGQFTHFKTGNIACANPKVYKSLIRLLK